MNVRKLAVARWAAWVVVLAVWVVALSIDNSNRRDLDRRLDAIQAAVTAQSVPALTLQLQACDDDRPGAPVRGACVSFDDATVTLLASPYGAPIVALVSCSLRTPGVACYTDPVEGDLVTVSLP
jgi:hypothetical protein